MKFDIFHFQQEAVNNLRDYTAVALSSYKVLHKPQVVSLQAPTGAGKTIIITALIEDIYNGTEKYIAQEDAIFVWLSDSPSLNEQSRQKIEAASDKINFGQCIMVNEADFNKEVFDDGFIYFLNTQKISRNANLCSHSDGRQYTIWETLENTLQQKSDRFYVIIDEAHRGALGAEAGRATTIMQRFIKGSREHDLSPMPVVIGMSATPERFNQLVEGISATLHKVIINAEEVRSSGLLKDRILLLHPDDKAKFNEMAVLEKAAREWLDKCRHWDVYSKMNHDKNVNPVFVIQVKASTKNDGSISDTDLDEVINRIESVRGVKFDFGEIVHTFGDKGEIEINGIKTPHIDPADISDNRKIKVVLFKENLSTGWDCPRAETMMSFRTAQDPTYITQLLGRMIRTPLQRHIMSDDSLNEVQLYLPHFDAENCRNVVEELRNTEVNDFPVIPEPTPITENVKWASARGSLTKKNPPRSKNNTSDLVQPVVLDNKDDSVNKGSETVIRSKEKTESSDNAVNIPQSDMPVRDSIAAPTQPDNNEGKNISNCIENNDLTKGNSDEESNELNRENIIKFINDFNLLSYTVRSAKINSYLKSLLMLSDLLTNTKISPSANTDIRKDMVKLIHDYINELKRSGEYEELRRQIIEMKLAVHIYDMFGKEVKSYVEGSLLSESDELLDPQLRIADTKMGNCGLPEEYNKEYYNNECSNTYKIDSILFAIKEECITSLENYAEGKFIKLKDTYRVKLTNQPEKIRRKYNDVVAGADLVSEHSFILPERIGQDMRGDPYEYHLFADEETGLYKAELNDWERAVLEEEMQRDDFVCWIRNKARASWALAISYEIRGEFKPFYPDFIIIRKDEENYVMDILEPHNPKFDDNLAKAKGFARYIQKENRIGRLQMIREDGGRFKRLDLALTEVQERVLKAVTQEEYNNIFIDYGFYDN